ncbi:MAG: hypothetical protein EU549_00080 [Promethearchaeota archaeon]|nr:MAG: hypothetical protein EU549_00080 [Candidatus Lokiarchaeota archaeon]
MVNERKAKALIKRAIKKDDIEEINKLILEHPTLIDKFEELNLYGWLDLDQATIAGVGVMEDELAGAVRAEDVIKSIIVDFRKNTTEIEVYSILDRLERQGYIQRRGVGWVLTAKGAEVCDSTLAEINNR